MATAHPVTYWDCKECPLKEECNEKNFRGWKPWGPTEQAARDIVLEHLMNCGLHKIEGLDRGDEFTALANECVIDEVPWVERRSKRGRTSGWDGPEFSEAACPPRGAASAFKTVIELAQSAVDAGLAGPRPGKRAIGACPPRKGLRRVRRLRAPARSLCAGRWSPTWRSVRWSTRWAGALRRLDTPRSYRRWPPVRSRTKPQSSKRYATT